MNVFPLRDRMLQGPIEPPTPVTDVELDRRRNDAFTTAFFEVVTGAPCDFWPANGWRQATDSPQWDNEQQIAVFVAVQRAASMIGATAEQRWKIVAAELRRLADRYADEKAREVSA